MSLLPAPAVFVAFCSAAAALILTPGPDTMYVLARGVQARQAGVRSALGIATGVLCHTLAATLGLAALFRAVPAASRVVTYAGAVYLIYLGVQTIRTDEFDAGADGGPPTDAAARSFRRGVLVNLLNPKVALFFLAFLPWFAGTGPDATARMAVLGATYAVLTAVYLGTVAAASGRVGRALSSATTTRRLRWLGGGVMIALGVGLAVE